MVFDVRAWLAEQLHCDAAELELDVTAKRGDVEEYGVYRRGGVRPGEVVISGRPAARGGHEGPIVTAFLSAGRRPLTEIAAEARVIW